MLICENTLETREIQKMQFRDPTPDTSDCRLDAQSFNPVILAVYWARILQFAPRSSPAHVVFTRLHATEAKSTTVESISSGIFHQAVHKHIFYPELHDDYLVALFQELVGHEVYGGIVTFTRK